MKNNGLNGNQEFEKLLKDKMNELSSSVDCFDRISAKAFPEKNPDFSESGFVVCDLENITGKSKKLPFLKWTAFVTACVVCAVIIPKSTFFNNFIANFSSNSKKTYNKIIEEINTETAENSYRVYDMPLDNYIKYDKLVTPLYSCPFEDCGKDGVNVRIFVRTFNDIPTNQIYAVEYMGEYIQSNFIAVADSKAKFTDKDFESLDSAEVNISEVALNEAVKVNFTPTTTAESYITDKYDNKVSLASFEYESIFKSDDDVQKIVSQVLYYGDRINESPEKYYYDINNTPDIDTEGVWKHSVCFDGFSAIPEENKSLFIQTPLFNDEISVESSVGYAFIMPDYPYAFTDYDENESNEINFYSLDLRSFSDSDVSMVAVPYDKEVLKTLKMYFSQSGMFLSSDSDVAMVVTSDDTGMTEIISWYDENYYSIMNVEEENAKRQIEAENAILTVEDERYFEFTEQSENEQRRIEAEKAKQEDEKNYEFEF